MNSKHKDRKLKASLSIFTLSQVHSWAMRAKIVVWFRRLEEKPVKRGCFSSLQTTKKEEHRKHEKQD